MALHAGRKNIAPGAYVYAIEEGGIKEVRVIVDTRDQEEGKSALRVQEKDPSFVALVAFFRYTSCW
jgi:hypothetical protein